MTKTYELVVLLSPDMTEHQVQQAQQSVQELVTKHQGKVVSTDVWGKRVLAYAIKKHTEATYILFNIDMETEQVQAFERAFRLSDMSLRHLLVIKDDTVVPVKEKAD